MSGTRQGYAHSRLAKFKEVRRGFWAALGDAQGVVISPGDGGTGLPQSPFLYAWKEQRIQRVNAIHVFSDRPRGKFGTTTGGTVEGDLGPAMDAAEMKTVGGVYSQAIGQPISAGTYVWMELGFDDQNPPHLVWIFNDRFPVGAIVANVDSVVSGARGVYNGTILVGPATDTGSTTPTDLAIPDGLTNGASCLILNAEESTFGVPVAANTNGQTGSHVLLTQDGTEGEECVVVVGAYVGMSKEATPRPQVMVRGGTGNPVVYTNLQPAIDITTFDASQHWPNSSGGGVKVWLLSNKDPGEGIEGPIWREFTFDARGNLVSISAETQSPA